MTRFSWTQSISIREKTVESREYCWIRVTYFPRIRFAFGSIDSTSFLYLFLFHFSFSILFWSAHFVRVDVSIWSIARPKDFLLSRETIGEPARGNQISQHEHNDDDDWMDVMWCVSNTQKTMCSPSAKNKIPHTFFLTWFLIATIRGNGIKLNCGKGLDKLRDAWTN